MTAPSEALEGETPKHPGESQPHSTPHAMIPTAPPLSMEPSHQKSTSDRGEASVATPVPLSASTHSSRTNDTVDNERRQSHKDTNVKASDPTTLNSHHPPPVWLGLLEYVHDALHQFIQAQKSIPRTAPRSPRFVSRTTAVLVVLVATTMATSSGRRSLFWSTLVWMWHQGWRGLRTTLGVALGVAVGLGWASHVYDQLDVWEQRQQTSNLQKQTDTHTMPSLPSRRALASTRALSAGQSLRLVRYDSMPQVLGDGTASTTPSSTLPLLHDAQTYTSLMMSAGYHVRRAHHEGPPTTPWLMRGHVLRVDQVPRHIWYPLTEPTNGAVPYKAVLVLQDVWPTLPASVTAALGKAVELILRDYIAAWYTRVDPGCRITSTSPDASRSAQTLFPRVMLYSVAVYQPLPFYDALYESCATLFGNLATRVEHVNVLELLLLKWTRILAHTFKTYRALRKHVQPRKGVAVSASAVSPDRSSLDETKRASRRGMMRSDVTESSPNGTESAHGAAHHPAPYTPVSEIGMTKEFLFAGKLHKAVTFGLDVPSFLFTDPNGKECGKPRRASDGSIVLDPYDEADEEARQHFTDDDVLSARLFDTNVIAECEVDYNRVLGHRMVRALVSRADFGSAIVSSILTEIMASCVLQPIMSLFAPETMNGWIIAGLGTKPASTDTGPLSGTAAPLDTATAPVDSEPQRKSVRKSRSGASVHQPLQPVNEGELENDTIEVVLHDRDLLETSDSLERGNAYAQPSDGHRSESSLEHQSTDISPDSPIFAALKAENSAISSEPLSTMAHTANSTSHLEGIAMTLIKTLIDLQEHVDFEECRMARANKQTLPVEWDDPGCRAAVIRLVLVVEAALTHGRCTYNDKTENGDDEAGSGEDEMDDNSDRPVEVTLPQYESTTLTQLLMELTNNIDAFEVRVASENALLRDKVATQFAHKIPLPYKSSVTDQSTLRTLIAVWLHSGQLHQILTLLVQAHATILIPFYHSSAFLRSKADANEFARQLRSLEGVEIAVDTMYVQASPRLEDLKEDDFQTLIQRSVRSSSLSSPPPSPQTTTQFLGAGGVAAPSILSAQFMTPSSTPRHLDFNRNETFAASLRSERERRIQSWERIVYESMEEGVPIVHRKRGATDEDKAAHVELHHIAKIFFAGTNMLALRDAGRRPNIEPTETEGAQSVQSSVGTDNGDPFALLLVETACPKRRIEVPDDDSSFLLRAQPRPLNAVGVHRDQRNHDQSFKCFAATYDEPVLNAMTDKQNGGRYIRRCLIRYYPIDRTASVALQNDVRKLDQRKYSGSVPSTITLGRVSRTAPFLSADFLKERHLCNRVQQKGSTKPQSILSSSVMEATDFTSWPRPGKAIEFVYRMTFFERPGLDLGGKRFTVADAAALGAHRADASALEMSDASLSFALMTMGSDTDEGASDADKGQRRRVEMGKDGYPVIWMKFSRNQDDAQVELKQYRTSFVRAALLITAARHEAQLRCLVHCVKAGSAKKATKAMTDSYLKPTLRLIEYAGSPNRGKQSILLRDLRLGVTHLDKGQLRRNALLSPRYPTELVDLTAVVEDVVDGPDSKGVDLFGGSTSIFSIKCTAIVSLAASDQELIGDVGYHAESGMLAETYKEEWVVHRTMKELQIFHKHLKMQVSMTESSGTAGSRLVGAATAAFSTTTSVGKSRQRKMLIPSLSNASKAGTLGTATKKLKLKHKETFDNYLGYLLSPGHLLGRCSELLLFLGASFPLSPDVHVGGEVILSHSDPLGRTAMSRTVMRLRAVPSPIQQRIAPTDDNGPETGSSPPQRRISRLTSINSVHSVESQEEDLMDDDEDGSAEFMRRNNAASSYMIPAVKSKIDKVMLSQVRNRLFELLRYQFGFENASFARNRLLAALKTASFAVTTPTEFRKLLYKLHTEHLNSEAVSGWIHFLIDTLWPNGVFFEAQPVPSREEYQAQAIQAKDLLHQSFPDQVRAILGQDLTRDGMDIFHEMLQNRLVVKSMAYMLFDLLWLEVFPEIGDVLSCGAALDIADTQP